MLMTTEDGHVFGKGGNQRFFMLLLVRVARFVQGFTNKGEKPIGPPLFKLHTIYRGLQWPENIERPSFPEWLETQATEYQFAVDCLVSKVAKNFSIPSDSGLIRLLHGSTVQIAGQYYLGMEPTAAEARKKLMKSLETMTEDAFIGSNDEQAVNIAAQ